MVVVKVVRTREQHYRGRHQMAQTALRYEALRCETAHSCLFDVYVLCEVQVEVVSKVSITDMDWRHFNRC
jgi:hypothetical protein